MAFFNCGCRSSCTAAALIAGAVTGILTAFLQITGVIVIPTVFLWVVFGIAVAYLGILVLAAALTRSTERSVCLCTSLNGVLTGILGSILLTVSLLAIGIVATSVVSAILVGLLLFSATLMIAGSACLIRCLFGCGEA